MSNARAGPAWIPDTPWALPDVGRYLDIAQNEMVSTIGPPGTGKTTVLRVPMTRGTISDAHNPTMITVARQMGFAREISDRACFVYEGDIAEQGTPDQIFGDPRNERTRPFLHAVLDAN